MLFAFLLFGSFWFWPAVIIPAIILIALVENERGFWALATAALWAAAFVAFGDPKLVPWLVSHPINVAEGILGYIVIGIVWGFVKWFFHVLRARDRYEELRTQFDNEGADYRKQQNERRVYAAKHSAGRRDADEVEKAEREKIAAEVIPTGFDKELFQSFAKDRGVDLSEFPPRAAKNKGRIIFWMGYWPFSALWTLLNDPITRFYRMLYARLGAIFEHISKSMFSKYQHEL